MAIILRGLFTDKKEDNYCGKCGWSLINGKCKNSQCSRDKD